MFVSCFYFFYSYFVYLHFFYFYVFIYFFSIFFFKKILVVLICSIMKIYIFKNCIFVWLNACPPVFPKDFFNRNGTSCGPSQRLPWPPCPALPLPCPCLALPCPALLVTSSTGNEQWLEESSRHCPHRQTPLLL